MGQSSDLAVLARILGTEEKSEAIARQVALVSAAFHRLALAKPYMALRLLTDLSRLIETADVAGSHVSPATGHHHRH